MKKGQLLGLLSLLGFFFSTAQDLTQTIKGRIIDQQAKTPLIGATILIVGSDPPLGAVTDVDGYFKIPNVPIGRHTLRISSVGYETATLPETLVGSGKEVVLNVELIESIIKMDELVIVADRQAKGEPLNELASVSAISISMEETSRYAATFDDPARAALTYAGVTTGGDDLLNEIIIRGNSSKGILWRLEGVEIPNPNHFASIGSSSGGISMLSSAMMANSDFFTGAFSPQFGNATAGIFDLNMRKGNFDKHEHSIQAGLIGLAASSEGPISKNSRASYLVNYRYSTLALMEGVGLDLLGEQEDVVFQDLSFKVHVPTKSIGSFSLWGLGGGNTYSFVPNAALDEVYYEDEKRKMGVAGITHVFYLSDKTFVESVISGSYSAYKYVYDSLRIRVDEIEQMKERTLRVSSFVNHKFNARHTLRIGAIYSRLGYNLFNEYWLRETEEFQNTLDESGSASLYQGYANWQARPTDKLTLNSGFHLTHFGLNGSTYFEPRLGMRYNMGKRTLTAGAGLHSRMETLALYLSRQQQDGGGFTQENRDLGFSRAAHAVIGMEQMLRQDIRFKVEAYYQHLYDVPVYADATTDSDFWLTFSTLNTYDGYTSDALSNDGKGRNMGLEFTLEKFFTNQFYFLTTMSLYDSKYTGIDGVWRDTRFNGNYVFNFVGGKEYKVGKNDKNAIGVNTRFIFSGGKRQPPVNLPESQMAGENRYDFRRNFELLLGNYKRLDIGVSYRKNNTKSASVVAINVQNVFGIQNEMARYYSEAYGGIYSEKQLSVFPNLSYKIEF
jgi:hypothetical protein